MGIFLRQQRQESTPHGCFSRQPASDSRSGECVTDVIHGYAEGGGRQPRDPVDNYRRSSPRSGTLLIVPPQRPIPLSLRERPFTRADAVAAGITPSMLRGSRFRRLFRGVYVCADIADSPLLRLEGACLVLPPTTAASRLSAAAVFGLPVPELAEVHAVGRRGWLESRIDGIRVHEARRPRDIVEHRAYRGTSPTRTFLDLADLLDLVDLVIVGDAMVRLGLCTPRQLVDEAAGARSRRVALARRAAALVRPRVDSPMETRVRLLVVLAGLPEPEADLDIVTEAGEWSPVPTCVTRNCG